MMSKKWWLILLGAASLFALQCRAETSEEMLSACRTISTAKVSNGNIVMPEDFESGKCWGAFEVLQNLLRVENTSTKQSFFGVCMPEKATRTELIAIFIQYMGKHPEKYSDGFSFVVLSALWEPFHCK